MSKVKATTTLPALPATLPSAAAAPMVRYAPCSWGKAHIITVNVPNPKKGKSFHRFAMYRNGQTVADYHKAVGSNRLAHADLRWDVARGYVTLTAPAS